MFESEIESPAVHYGRAHDCIGYAARERDPIDRAAILAAGLIHAVLAMVPDDVGRTAQSLGDVD